MSFSIKVRVGTKFIKHGEVYRVYKIEKITSNNKADRLIHHKPHYTNTKINTVVCTIPESSISLTTVREPISRDAVDELLVSLAEASTRSLPNAIDAKNIFRFNDIKQTATVLKLYWAEMHRDDIVFPRSKKNVLEEAIDKISEEVAIVIGTTPIKARERVIAALG